jgi:predicted cupin superfamily sugar epimerase
MATAIYYLLERDDFSALHRIKSDELWHFHDGAPLEIILLSGAGVFSKVRLGLDLLKGERPQVCIPRGLWFGAAVCAVKGARFTLASCTVAPGFDFADFEMANPSELLKKFPQQRRMILKWTRGAGEAKVAS